MHITTLLIFLFFSFFLRRHSRYAAVAAPHFAFADNAASLDKLTNQLNSGALSDSLPAGVLPEGFNVTALPSQDDIVKVLKQKCEKNAGNEEEWTKIEEAASEFKTCVSDLVDVEKLQEEIEQAQPNGELDTVFNK